MISYFCLQSELTADFRSRRVPQLIGMPNMMATPLGREFQSRTSLINGLILQFLPQLVGHSKRQFTPPGDRSAVAGGCVALPCESLRPALAVRSRPIPRVQRSLATGVVLVPPTPLALGRTKTVHTLVPQQVGPQYLLTLRADENDPLSPVMLRLVRLRTIGPYQTSRIHSHGRRVQISPGRAPVNRWSLTMSATMGGK